MLRFVGIDPNTNGDECPAVWFDEEAGDAGEIIVQGWKADEALLAATEANSPLAPDEAVVRIPARMAPLLREACIAVERAHV